MLGRAMSSPPSACATETPSSVDDDARVVLTHSSPALEALLERHAGDMRARAIVVLISLMTDMSDVSRGRFISKYFEFYVRVRPCCSIYLHYHSLSIEYSYPHHATLTVALIARASIEYQQLTAHVCIDQERVTARSELLRWWCVESMPSWCSCCRCCCSTMADNRYQYSMTSCSSGYS